MIVVDEYKGPKGILTMHYTGRSGIAVMSVAANGLPKLTSITLLPTDPSITWGSAVVEVGGYLFLYGADIAGVRDAVTGMEVAARACRRVTGHQQMDVLERLALDTERVQCESHPHRG